jgi:hypothetical protein
MGCASLDRQWWRGEGMRRPKWDNTTSVAARRECAGQMEQHQIGGSAANAPANEEIVARRWDAPAEQRECGAAMRFAGRTKRTRRSDGCTGRTRNGGALMECAGQTNKRRCADGMRRPKEKEDDESLLMEHHLREKSSREMTSSRN